MNRLLWEDGTGREVWLGVSGGEVIAYRQSGESKLFNWGLTSLAFFPVSWTFAAAVRKALAWARQDSDTSLVAAGRAVVAEVTGAAP